MRRDSERRPSVGTEAAEDHIGDAITPSLPPRSDSLPARLLRRAVVDLDALAVACLLAVVLWLPLAVGL